MKIPTSRQRASQVDMQTAMTPLIDVVFQLLIFFICASTGHMRELLLRTDFHSGAVGAAAKPDVEKPLGQVRIQLKRSDDKTVVVMEGRELANPGELDSTLQSLAAAAVEIPVILDIGDEVPLGDVIHVYDRCRAARFQSVNFAADPAKMKGMRP